VSRRPGQAGRQVLAAARWWIAHPNGVVAGQALRQDQAVTGDATLRAMAGPKTSADRLREYLYHRPRAMWAYTSEPLYHAEVEWTCRLLGIVDDVADAETAERVTDAIREQLAGDSVTAAIERAQDRQAETGRLTGTRGGDFT
jgi:hypothetical protein